MRRAALLPLVGALAACAHAPGPGRGLWIGPIHACRDTVAGAALSYTEEDPGRPSLVITLRPEGREALARETTGLVGRQMPVRLNGRVLTEPVINEPILGGVMAISGGDRHVLERMRVAAGWAC